VPGTIYIISRFPRVALEEVWLIAVWTIPCGGVYVLRSGH
jgi:hypothetical protein